MPTPRILVSLHGRRIGLASTGELIIDGSRVTGPTRPVLYRQAPPGYMADPSLYHTFFDDMHSADYHTYTSTDDGATGTNAYQDVSTGVLNVLTAAQNNDYHAMSTNKKNWLFAAGKELWFEARFKLAEATTNESAWWFGLTSTLTTGGFQAGTAGPLASYSGALVYKQSTSMAVRFQTSNGATQNTLSTGLGTFVTNTWTKVGFYFDGAATTSTIAPFADVGAGWVAGTAQNITLSGLAQMALVFGVKAGATAGVETLQVDYVKCTQLR